MAHIAQTGRCHIQHNGGCGIAHIAHVGRAGFVAELSGVKGMYLLIQRLFQHITDVIPVKELSELGLDIAESIFIIASEHFCRHVKVRLAPFRRTHFHKALIHKRSESLIGRIVGEGHGYLKAHLGAGHQCRALGNIHHSGEKLLHLTDLGRAHFVLDDRMALHHIGCGAAGIGIGIVDTGRIYHMFTQIVYTNIHKLHRIQCGTAQMG